MEDDKQQLDTLLKGREQISIGSKNRCGLCHEKFEGYGNNPAPLEVATGSDYSSQVCDDCNADFVIPARLSMLFSKGGC